MSTLKPLRRKIRDAVATDEMATYVAEVLRRSIRPGRIRRNISVIKGKYELVDTSRAYLFGSMDFAERVCLDDSYNGDTGRIYWTLTNAAEAEYKRLKAAGYYRSRAASPTRIR